MRIYGYVMGSKADGAEEPVALEEVTIAASPAALHRLAEFLLHVAEGMERHGAGFGHEHFDDYAPEMGPTPEIIVAAPDYGTAEADREDPEQS